VIKTVTVVQALAVAAIEIVSEWGFGVNTFRFPGNLEITLPQLLKNLAFDFVTGVV